jgi:ACT domain-containing protein
MLRAVSDVTEIFLNLCNTLKINDFLRSSRYVKITEQVAAFCLVISHFHKQMDVADSLQRSLETISMSMQLRS